MSLTPTRVDSWLNQASVRLEAAGIGTARLDCLILLEDVTNKDRSWLLAHPEHVLSPTQLKTLAGWLDRRTKHEPLAYIRHKTEFYGREFWIDERVLQPRPESESLIDELKQL